MHPCCSLLLLDDAVRFIIMLQMLKYVQKDGLFLAIRNTLWSKRILERLSNASTGA